MRKLVEPSKPLEIYFSLEHLWQRPLDFFRRVFHLRPKVSRRKLMIGMLSKLADADGIRGNSESLLLEQCIVRWFSDSPSSKLEAFRMLAEIRRSQVPFEGYVNAFAKHFSWSEAMRANAFESLCSIAFADGILHSEEDRMLNYAANALRISLAERKRVWMYYQSIRSSPDDKNFNQTEQPPHTPPVSHSTFPPGHWSNILGCSPQAALSEVKHCYRQLVMLYHPDRLKAQGMPEVQKTAAHERFLLIQKAYEEAIASYSSSG